MEIYDVMLTTAAVREFTGDPLPDDVLERILDNARFAPSGGNRQGAHVIVLRDRATREALAELSIPGARRYVAQLGNGESPWNPLHPPPWTRTRRYSLSLPSTVPPACTSAMCRFTSSAARSVTVSGGAAGGASFRPRPVVSVAVAMSYPFRE